MATFAGNYANFRSNYVMVDNFRAGCSRNERSPAFDTELQSKEG